MTLALQQTIQAQDLARALDGDQGTFFVQRLGQSFLAVAAEGHSIKSLVPIGNYVPVSVQSSGQEPWTITKVSNQELSTSQYDSQRQRTEQR